MKKLINFALLVLTISGFAQTLPIQIPTPQSDVIVRKIIAYSDTTTNTASKTFTCLVSGYTVDASFQINSHVLTGTLAGYAILQYSLDNIHWYVTGSTDSVALINAADTAVRFTRQALYGIYHRVVVSATGTQTVRFGFSYCYKRMLVSASNLFKAGIKSSYLDTKSSFISNGIAVDSFSMTNSVSKTYSLMHYAKNGANTTILNPGQFDGELTVNVLVDTVAGQTMAGNMYLQASIDGVRWVNIQTVALVRKDYVAIFTPIVTYSMYYRVKITTTGTHKSRFGVAWVVNDL